MFLVILFAYTLHLGGSMQLGPLCYVSNVYKLLVVPPGFSSETSQMKPSDMGTHISHIAANIRPKQKTGVCIRTFILLLSHLFLNLCSDLTPTVIQLIR